jgi:3-mercaptopyruvate sulfurtransferase SseA
MIRSLRPLQIDPEHLKSRLDSEKFGVVDLLRFEEDPQGVAAIPGAVRLDPLELRRKKRVVVPVDVNLVYCRSMNCFVSARVAVALRKHGIHNIHVLAGGLEAWISLRIWKRRLPGSASRFLHLGNKSHLENSEYGCLAQD